MPLTPNTRLGRYEIRSLLGAGGMGEVYLAQDTQLRRLVAIKILSSDLTHNADRLRRFEQEAYAASALNHPNILTIHEIGKTASLNYIVTEHIDGESLRQRMKHSPRVTARDENNRQPSSLTIREALDIAIDIATALSAAHAANIIHRDIKPENIMLRRDGIVKVLDFGLAKLLFGQGGEIDQDAPTRALANTETGIVIGTVSYMSPEQVRGQQVDPRTDIWSLGVTLYEMVAGRPPFVGNTATEVLAQVIEREPVSPAHYVPQMPAELERIITKSLAKDSEERYQTTKDLLVDLRRLRRQLEIAHELERSIQPDNANDSQTTAANRNAPNTAAANPAQTTLGTEYIVGEFKRHKTAWLGLLIIAALAAGIWFFLHSRSVEAPVDSIAVLPFENKSAESDSEYLADGLTESLIYRLSQFPSLKVSPRSSTFRYKGKDIDPIKAGTELDVNAVLSGRIVQHGDDLTISAELTDVRNNKQLWGEQFVRKMSDLLATQREIAQEIAEKLNVKVSRDEQAGASKHYTESNEAYQLYLHGRYEWNKRTGESLDKAIDYFNQAIAKDPRFALAYAGLADCYVVPANPQPPKEKMPKAKAAAIRALQIDDTLAEAHTALARVLAVYDWDWDAAEKEFQRAIELNPRYAVAHQWYGGYSESMGRNKEAISERKRALELDPFSPIINFEQGLGFYYGRQYDKAIEQYKKTLELDPSFPPAYGELPAAYGLKGMYAEAIAGFQEGISIKGSGSEWFFSMSGLGYVYAVSGKKAEALAIINELQRLSERQYVPADRVAIIYAGLGEKDQAFSWLEKAYEEHSFNIVTLRVEPRWDSIRSDPRFAELMRKIRLPE